jgi:amidohydrolase
VEIKGTIRTFSKENRQFVKEQVELFLKHICAMNQAKYTFDYLPYYPSLINNEMMVN